MRSFCYWGCFSILIVISALPATAQKRQKSKDIELKRQVLEVIPELPDAIAAETGRLSFHVSPLSDKGLLSQQVRDALKAIERLNHGVPVIKLRAFVAGSGDLRRVRDIVAEEYSDHHKSLPVVSTIQAGTLPMVGAQVVLEAISSERRPVNPYGVGFFAGPSGVDFAAALTNLSTELSRAGVKPANVLRVTCFLHELSSSTGDRAQAQTKFPMAAWNFVQKQRIATQADSSCEAAARLDAAPATVTISPGAALVPATKIVLTGTQLVFGDQDADFRLSLQRISKSAAAVGAQPRDVFWMSSYALTRSTAMKLAEIHWEFLDRAKPPAGAALMFEGLPSSDATAALEWIAMAK